MSYGRDVSRSISAGHACAIATEVRRSGARMAAPKVPLEVAGRRETVRFRTAFGRSGRHT